MKYLLYYVSVVTSCDWYCGQWTCPWGACHDCWGGCTDASREFHGQTKLADQKHGTPKGYKRAHFHDKVDRVTPQLDLTGPPYPHMNYSESDRLNLQLDRQPAGMKPPLFTSYHLGTNWPVYSPAFESKEDLAPILAAAGINVWRWPGGAVSSTYTTCMINAKPHDP
jgi:hypothetical protein